MNTHKMNARRALPRHVRAATSISVMVPIGLFSIMSMLSFPTHGRAEGIEGISYTLTPAVERIRWDNDIGLEDTELFGGRFGLYFGKYVGVDGFLMFRDDVSTELDDLDLDDGFGQPLANQDVNLRNYGADVTVNLGTKAVVPFLRAGAGVMRFDTADGDDPEQVSFRWGGGMRFGIERFRASVWLEDTALRLDRYALAQDVIGVPFPRDPGSEDMRHNLTVGAGLDFGLGGHSGEEMTPIDRAVAERFEAGFKGLSFPIELIAGRLDFDDDSRFETQNIGGVRSGLDFGPYFGMRGYYWRGFEEGFDDTAPLASYGGEAQFNLNAGGGGIPYLLIGVGQLDFRRDFERAAGFAAEDKTMGILGGGLFLPLAKHVRLDFSLRDYVFGERDTEDVTSTDELAHNLALGAGLSFALGQGYASPEEIAKEERASLEKAAAKEAARHAEESAKVARFGEKHAAEMKDQMEGRLASDGKAAERFRSEGGRWVPIPVPEQGEIYVRYGPPGGVHVESRVESREGAEDVEDAHARSAREGGARVTIDGEKEDREQLREIIRDELAMLDGDASSDLPPTRVDGDDGMDERQGSDGERRNGDEAQQGADGSGIVERRNGDDARPRADGSRDVERRNGHDAPSSDGDGVTDEDLLALERRLEERIDRRFDDVGEQVQEVEESFDRGADTVVRIPEPAVDADADGEDRGWRARAFLPYAGGTVDDPQQFVLGTRVDLGPVRPDSRLRLQPQFDMGFGNDATSVHVAANLRYDLRELRGRNSFTPYVLFGGGILVFSEEIEDRSKQEGVIDIGYGVSGNLGKTTAFLEHQGVDLFDLNRLHLGLRWGMNRR